ncbi:unnamed protein product [Chrysoparadoxa australica]
MGHYLGQAPVAVMPESASEVSEVLRYCNQRRIGVVPQGGNTGLVGGSVAGEGDIILGTRRMNKVHSFDATAGVLVCEAGCILDDLDDYLRPHGFMMPLGLGASGSCHIGGNISTNAGGVRCNIAITYLAQQSRAVPAVAIDVCTCFGRTQAVRPYQSNDEVSDPSPGTFAMGPCTAMYWAWKWCWQMALC